MTNDKQFQDLLKDNDPLVDLSTSIERPPTANGSTHNLSPKELLEALDAGGRDMKYVASKITLTLMSNWGHRQFIGLTGTRMYAIIVSWQHVVGIPILQVF